MKEGRGDEENKMVVDEGEGTSSLIPDERV